MVTCDAGLGLSGCCALPKLLMAMATTASRLLDADALHAAAGADNQLGWCSLWTFLLSAGIQGTAGTDTWTRLQAQYGWTVPKLLRGDLVGLPTPHELKLTGMIAASRSVYVWDMLLEGNQPVSQLLPPLCLLSTVTSSCCMPLGVGAVSHALTRKKERKEEIEEIRPEATEAWVQETLPGRPDEPLAQE